MIRTVLRIEGETPGLYQDKLDSVLANLGYSRKPSDEMSISMAKRFMDLEKQIIELRVEISALKRVTD